MIRASCELSGGVPGSGSWCTARSPSSTTTRVRRHSSGSTARACADGSARRPDGVVGHLDDQRSCSRHPDWHKGWAMTADDAPVLWNVGTYWRFLSTDATTNGRSTTFEELCPPGVVAPPHVHDTEEEAFYVLEGNLVFLPRRSGDHRAARYPAIHPRVAPANSIPSAPVPPGKEAPTRNGRSGQQTGDPHRNAEPAVVTRPDPRTSPTN